MPRRDSMTHDDRGRIAILYPGDYEDRKSSTAEKNRFADLFGAFAAKEIHAEPAVHHDDFFPRGAAPIDAGRRGCSECRSGSRLQMVHVHVQHSLN